MIELKHISKNFGKKLVLDHVSMTFGDGMYGLLGPNGAGKTTLMRIMASVLEPDTGEIIVDGKKSISLRAQIGYLPQRFSFYKYLTVYESLEHVAYMKNVEKHYIKDSVNQVLEAVNLDEKGKDRIGSLSGGMVRRLGIAQALLGNPRLLIIDEPTVGLDPEERARFKNLLAEICKNRTVLISTHIVEDVELICDNIIILNEGKIIVEKKCEQLLESVRGKIWEIKTIEDVGNIAGGDIIKKEKKKDGYRYRVISENVPVKAVFVDPTLEDAYLYYIGENHVRSFARL